MLSDQLGVGARRRRPRPRAAARGGVGGAAGAPPPHSDRRDGMAAPCGPVGMLRRASMSLLSAMDDVTSAKRDLADLLAAPDTPERPGWFLRLAFNDAMTYDGATRTGGANASVR